MISPQYCEFQPAPHLRKHISAYWISEGFYSEEVMFPVFADGCCDIIFDLLSNEPAKLISTGVELSVVPLKGSIRLGGIRFLPGGFTALTGIPADEIYDGTDASDVLNRRLAEGLKRIGDGFSPQVLDAVFLSAATHPMIAFWMSRIDCNINDIVSYFGCSSKTVNRTFVRHTGVNPVKMMSVRRFQYSLSQVINGGKSLTEIAYTSGYSDQPHFIKDFKRYSGSTPSDFMRYKDSFGVRFIQFPSGCL